MIITASQNLSSQVDKTLEKLGVKRNITFGTTRFLTIRRMLSGRNTLAVMAEMVGRSALINDNLTFSPPPIDIPDFNIEMITLHRDSNHQRIVFLSTMVKKLIQDKVDELKFHRSNL